MSTSPWPMCAALLSVINRCMKRGPKLVTSVPIARYTQTGKLALHASPSMVCGGSYKPTASPPTLRTQEVLICHALSIFRTWKPTTTMNITFKPDMSIVFKLHNGLVECLLHSESVMGARAPLRYVSTLSQNLSNIVQLTQQVLEFISYIFPENTPCPSFISYDNACNLLHHIASHDITSAWLHTTRFIVDAFHYVNHWATDTLCHTRCNPSPANGSQPDLLLPRVNPATGHTVIVRAFNTEAAEQFNAWADGFEAQLRQMTNTNYDFKFMQPCYCTRKTTGRGDWAERRLYCQWGWRWGVVSPIGILQLPNNICVGTGLSIPNSPPSFLLIRISYWIKLLFIIKPQSFFVA